MMSLGTWLRRTSILVLPVLGLSGTASSALGQGAIGGVVVSDDTRRPLATAQVLVVGTPQATLTDAQGRFLIPNVAGEEVELRVTLLGYRAATVRARVGSTDLRLVLAQTALALDEIVVTGTPGGTQARAMGNVIGRVPAHEVVERTLPSDVQAMLSAHVPGLRIQKAGGAVGVGGNTRIRGHGSITLSGEPLIFVDGIRVDGESATNSPAFPYGDKPSRINDINPEDIESIEVIKGPAAATLYGTEASNGIIHIITKRGRSGEPTFEARISQGASFLARPERVFPSAWGTHPETGELYEHNVLIDEKAAGRSPFRTGQPQGYGLSMRGGTGSVRYFVTGSFDRDEGIVSYNWQDKLSGRANVGYTSDKWDISTSLGAIQQRTRSPNVTQPFTVILIWNQLHTIGDPDLRGYRRNPPEDFEALEGYEDINRTTTSVTVSNRPLPWLSHRFIVGADVNEVRGSRLFPRHPDGAQGPWGASSLGYKSVSTSHRTNWSADYSATASFDVTADLSLVPSVGAQYYQRTGEWMLATGQVFPAPGLETVSAAATRFGDEGFTEEKSVGVYAQQQLGWKNRLFLTGALRADDHSAFGRNFSFVVYPKLSASWVVTEEPFWSLGVVNQLRLRTAWGQAGRQPSAFAAHRLLSPTVGPGGVAILTLGNVGNPDLEPEVGDEVEVGFDASLFDERVAVEVTYYSQRTRGAIVAQPALPSQGFPGSQFVNLGEVSNKGTELGLGYQAIRGEAVGLDFALMFSTNENRLIDAGGVEPGGGIQRNVEGYPLQSIFQRRIVNAEFDEDGSLINVLCEGGDPLTGGGGPVPCSEAGTAYWGPVTPRWEGSFSSTVRYRNVTLFGLVDFLGGHYRIDSDIHFAHTFYRTTETVQKRLDPVLAAYMELGLIDGRQPGTIKAGFAKLRHASATYEFPAQWAQRFAASRASLTFSGENLATPWLEQRYGFGRKQVDPEVRSNDSELNAFNQEKWPTFTRLHAMLRVSF